MCFVNAFFVCFRKGIFLLFHILEMFTRDYLSIKRMKIITSKILILVQSIIFTFVFYKVQQVNQKIP